MANDIRIEITGDSSDIKKVVTTAEKLVKRFEKANSSATQRRLKTQKKAAEQERKSEEKKGKKIAAMEKRFSRKRAKNRLRLMKDRIKIAKREAKAEERIRKRSLASLAKFGKLGLAGVGIGGAAGVTIAAKGILDFDFALTQVANQADISRKKQAELRKSIIDTSVAYGVNRNIILGAVRSIVAESGNLAAASDNIEQIAKIIAIEGPDAAEAMGITLANLTKQFEGTGQSVFDMFEQIIASGDKGSISTDQFAIKSAELLSTYKSLGSVTRKSFADFLALTNIMKDQTGTMETGSTAVKSFIKELTSKKGREAFGKLGKQGVKVWKEGTEEVRDLQDIISDVLTQTGGLKTQWEKTNLSSESMAIFWNAISGDIDKSGQRMAKFNLISKTGVNAADNIERKFGRISETGLHAFNRMAALITKMTDKTLKQAIDSLANSMEKIISDPQKMKDLEGFFTELGKNLLVIADALGLIAGTIGPILKLHKIVLPDTGQVDDPVKARTSKILEALPPELRQKAISEIGLGGFISGKKGEIKKADIIRDILIENSLVFDTATSTLKKSTINVKGLKRNDTGQAFVNNVVKKMGVGLPPS